MAHRDQPTTRHHKGSSIIERTSSHDIARLAGLHPNRQGFIRCPIHAEDSPSCHLLERGYYCFGCGAKGGLLDLAIALGVARDRASAACWLEKNLTNE